MSNGSCIGSRFTNLDSCFFLNGAMNNYALSIEVDGFMRATTFAFNGSYMGTTVLDITDGRTAGAAWSCGQTWTKHNTTR